MPFLASENPLLSSKDLLSWTFDHTTYDRDESVLIDASDPSRSFSSNQARTIIRRLASGFRAAGLRKGDCVCIHSFNDVYYPLLVLGIIAAGGIFTGTNPSYTQYELAHTIKTAEVSWLISEPEVLSTLSAAAQQCNIPKNNIWVFHPLRTQNCPKGWTSYEALLQHGEADWTSFDNLDICKQTIAMRLFSSGTTGLPKAVNISHHNLIAQHELVWEGSYAKKRTWQEVNLFPLPMFHAAIAPRTHTSTFKTGDKTYIMRRFHLEQFLLNIERYSVTNMTVVPPMAIDIIKSPLSRRYSLKSVKHASSGAAPLGRETQASLQKLLASGCPLTQVWGMTESCCIVSRLDYLEEDETGSIGRLIPALDMKLVDDDGHDMGEVYNTRGEMCLRGPTIVLGYHKNAKANIESFDTDGFYHTGDIGYCDSKTHLWYIVDRKKELIKVRGFQVAPPEIEAVLLDHPKVIDCAIVGVKYYEPGQATSLERPRAYVVRKPGTTEQDLSADDLKEYVKPKLAKYKWLEGGVRFIDVIPKSPNGKILKRILKEQAELEARGQKGAKL